MAAILNIEPWWRFGAALIFGALIGLEREYTQQHKGKFDFAGIRTFSLIALLGAVSAYLAGAFDLRVMLFAFGGLILLTVVSYVGAVVRTGRESGITTEVAALLAFLLGAMAIWDMVEIGGAMSVIIALVLSLKGRLHQVVRQMSIEDLRVTLQFALVWAVVLPLLPNRPIDPFGVLNPFQVWLMVVFVSGIGFFGYMLTKVLGTGQGIRLTGLVGGLASSTATTISFATRSRENPPLSIHFAQAILLASAMMFPRTLVEVAVVHSPLMRIVTPAILVMLLATAISVYVLWQKSKHDEQAGQDEEKDLALSNPLKLSTAIMFGLVFAVVLVLIELAGSQFGSGGVYLTSLLAGLADVDAITLSVSGLAGGGQLEADTAGIAVIIAAIMNTFSKAVIAYASGAKEMRPTILRAFSLIILSGIISGLVTAVIIR